MTGKQYNNIIAKTLKMDNKKDADNLGSVRKIFKNMGVAFPNGRYRKVLDTLRTNDYMAWRECDITEAKEKADRGIATIAVLDDRIQIVSADNEENNHMETFSDMVFDIARTMNEEGTAGILYYSYSNAGTTGGINTSVFVESIEFDGHIVELEVGEEYDPSYTVNPVNASNYHLLWSGNRDGVVSVNPYTGHILALGIGHATITVSVEGANVSASYEVRVIARTSNSIAFPSGRNCNWYQHGPAVLNAIHRNDGCRWTCLLDIVNIYTTGQEISPSLFINNCPFLGWDISSFCNVSFSDWSSLSVNDFDDIRNEIDHGRVVLLEITDQAETEEHWVVAYGYTNNGIDNTGILVLDPGLCSSGNYGCNYTLYEAMANNHNKDKYKGKKYIIFT